MNRNNIPLGDSLANVKNKQKSLEFEITKILSKEGTGDLKLIKSLANVINFIKDQYLIEEKELSQRYDDQRPVAKIIIHFTKQIYLKLYIMYSIKYINTLSFQFTPEFREKFVQNLKKVKDIEIEVLGMDKDERGHLNEQGSMQKRLDKIRALQKAPSTHYINTPLIPSIKGNEAAISDDRKGGMSGDLERQRKIIIEMLKTYDIPYRNGDSNQTLLYILKDGFNALMNFITEAISTGPKHLDMLKSLHPVRGELNEEKKK